MNIDKIEKLTEFPNFTNYILTNTKEYLPYFIIGIFFIFYNFDISIYEIIFYSFVTIFYSFHMFYIDKKIFKAFKKIK